MELFPAQPDLSLQISPPNRKPTWGRRRSTQQQQEEEKEEEERVDLGFWSQNKTHFPNFQNLLLQQQLFQQQSQDQIGFLRPIKGIPLYQQTPPLHFPQKHHRIPSFLLEPSSTSPSSTCTTSGNSRYHNNNRGGARGGALRAMPRFPGGKRPMRAPRMRWTTSLHDRFVRAVELLGGHQSTLALLLSLEERESSILSLYLLTPSHHRIFQCSRCSFCFSKIALHWHICFHKCKEKKAHQFKIIISCYYNTSGIDRLLICLIFRSNAQVGSGADGC